MRIIDRALSAVLLPSAVLFLAYVGYHAFDIDLFTALPESIRGFFVNAAALQYVALAVLVIAVIAKVSVGRALKRERAARPARDDDAVLRRGGGHR